MLFAVKAAVADLEWGSQGQQLAAVTAPGDVVGFSFGEVFHNHHLGAGAFFIQPGFVNDFLHAVGKLVIEIQLFIVCFILLDILSPSILRPRAFQGCVRRVVFAVRQPQGYNFSVFIR